jgi:uncharacterized protein (DUF1330 family)
LWQCRLCAFRADINACKEKRVTAYVIANIKVTDPAGYEGYKKVAGAAIEACGGRYLVRGGKTDVLEGEWHPDRMVVLEFDSVEKARAWWNSTQYAAARGIRQRTAISSVIVVEGI